MKSRAPKFWTFGGGKGGVGKSFLTSAIGVALARKNKSVIAVDADLGSANLHTYLGIKNPNHTLLDHLENGLAADDVLLPTFQSGLRLISCAGDILGMANPQSERKEKIIQFIAGLQADYILVDLGAGTSYTVLDFFNMSHEGIVIVTPDPASMQSAYAFIKSAIYRRIQMDFSYNEAVMQALHRCLESDVSQRPRTMMEFYDLVCTTDPTIAESVAKVVEHYEPLLLINLAGSAQDQRVAEIIQSASKKFLNVNIRLGGMITMDPIIRRACQRMEILGFDDPHNRPAKEIQNVVNCLLNCSDEEAVTLNEASQVPSTPTMGLNDNLDFMGKQIHIQTEDLGFKGRSISTQVFCEGRVILSTKSEYPASLKNRSNPAEVTELMRKQHFNVIRELESKKARILHST